MEAADCIDRASAGQAGGKCQFVHRVTGAGHSSAAKSVWFGANEGELSSFPKTDPKQDSLLTQQRDMVNVLVTIFPRVFGALSGGGHVGDSSKSIESS